AQANQTDDTTAKTEPSTEAIDDKQARVAAAVAKAKAKKRAQANQTEDTTAKTEPSAEVVDDESTGDIAPNAALANATESADLSPEQMKKAKVAAAVAKAKAKQLAKRAEQEEQ
ncbi:MAG: electron transport complex subunit RsxC, partial [Shewanella sp.]